MTVAPLRAGVASATSPPELSALREFREGWFGCLGSRADALFELSDAVLSAPTISSLPYLSLEPVFRRSWRSLYDALAEGTVGAGRVRELLVASASAHWPLSFAVDASTSPRPYAETSPGREWHHLSGPGGVDGRVPGWAWQHVTQLNGDHDSWVAPMDAVRVGTGGTAQTLAAVGQIRGLAERLRAAGQAGRKLFVHDAGYDLAVLVYELHGEADVTGEQARWCADLPADTHHRLCRVHTVTGNDDVELLVRIRNDRLLYRDPPPRPADNGGRPGRPRRHGEQFSCARPDTWDESDQRLTLHDEHYGQVTVTAWSGLHPKLDAKEHFADRAETPILSGTVIRVQVERLPGGRKPTPKPMWLFWSGEGTPDLDPMLEIISPQVRHRALPQIPQERARLDQHRTAPPGPSRALDLDPAGRLQPASPCPPPRPRSTLFLGTPPPPQALTRQLLIALGTPATPPKPSKAGPGRPKGRSSTPAPRHPARKKTA